MRIGVDDRIRIERDEQGALVSVHASDVLVAGVTSIVAQPFGERTLVTVEYEAGAPVEHSFFADAAQIEEV